MRTGSIRVGDIVYANKRGRLFHARVTGAGADGTLTVEPIERNISYRHVDAAEIADHWAHPPTKRRAARTPKTQTTLDLSLPH